MNTTPQRGRLVRLAPLAGTVGAVATMAAYLTIGPNPDADATPSKIVAYYASHHAHVFLAGMLLAYAALLLAVFGVGVWTRIREAGASPVIAGVALVGTSLAAASDVANATGWCLLGDLGSSGSGSPGALQALHVTVAAAALPEAIGAGMLLGAVAAAGIASAAFPRWIAWSALALAILQLAPTPGMFGFLVGLVYLVWLFAAGIALSVRHSRRERATEAAFRTA